MLPRMITLVAGSLILNICIAQTDSKFIEVTVNDTVLVQPDLFIYRLSVSPDFSTELIDTAAAKLPGYYTKRAEQMREKQKQAKEEWIVKIRKAGYRLMPQSLNDAFIKNDYDMNAINVMINSTDSLSAFFGFIKNEKGLNGNLLSARSSSSEAYYDSLYKKLLLKARKRAGYIASSIGKKIVDISSISESRFFNPGWNMLSSAYSPPAPLPYDSKTLITSYQIQGNLTVRFLIR